MKAIALRLGCFIGVVKNLLFPITAPCVTNSSLILNSRLNLPPASTQVVADTPSILRGDFSRTNFPIAITIRSLNPFSQKLDRLTRKSTLDVFSKMC